MLDGGDGCNRRVFHVLVVLAHENHRKLPDDGEVERLVEGPDVGRAVAEETDGDLSRLTNLCGPGGAGGDGQVSPDDRIRSHGAASDVGQMHRPALAMQHAVPSPE